MKSRFFFPVHLNAGNRGCEAIAKGTAAIIGCDRDRLIGYCSDIALDARLGVGDYVTLVPYRKLSFGFRVFRKIHYLLISDEHRREIITDKYVFHDFLDDMRKDDILLSTGGDMFCYGNNSVNYTTDYAANHGHRCILWGCSIGENNLTAEKLNTLKKFSIIYARETLTKAVLENHGFSNVVVFPDPAFILKAQECALPAFMDNSSVVGLNLSNFVLGGYDLKSKAGNQVCGLLKYILAETDFQILLIPHVTWKRQDDREVNKAIIEEFHSDRIHVLNIDNLNYCQIRYVISKCRFFIGARTHAMISAYSMCVPSLALGYSIKSAGIAKDLKLPDWAVYDSRNPDKISMTELFRKLCIEESNMKKHMQDFMPIYIEKLANIPNTVLAGLE